jgi:uncharacterized membrane protein YeaQ/YmgE (transglycosylase-associated protein family)
MSRERLRRVVLIPFAQITLDSGSLLTWLAVGLLAGFFAGYLIKGGGFGILGDMVAGSVGALIGGFVFGLVDPGWAGFAGSIGIAFLSACVCIAIGRFVVPERGWR